ncbi:MAG: [protein-PII] uridylyltransferase [Pseudomonadota bacterium]
MAKIPLKLEKMVDGEALRRELTALTASTGGDGSSRAVRQQALDLFKRTILEGREAAETMLLQDGSGSACAERLSHLMDEVIRALYDFATVHVYRSKNRSAAERMAVIAVGGYGRGTLAPGSDIDLLFLLPYKQTPWGEQVAEYMLYVLWDLGLKVGHATRNIDECIRLSRGDITIRTSILEARFLWGDEKLFSDLVARFDDEVVKDTGAEYVQAKLAERDERHRKAGESRYLVEPNIKDGKGGLRDLHTLFWIGKYFYRVRTADELVEKGVFTTAEHRLFLKAEDFLWAVRCHMHFATGKAEERLHFDIQREIAERLGYTSHPGLSAVERFMKHYFLVAKDVGDLTRIFCAALEEEQAKHVPGFNRLFLSFSRRKKKLPGTSDFLVDNSRINIAADDIFEKDPVNLLRLFWLADRHGLEYHPDALKLVTRSLGLIDRNLRRNQEANRLFMDILTSDRNPELNMRRMNEAGVLGRLIPDFGKIVAMMQFNMYHHYTVDEHTIRAVAHISDMEHGRGEKVALVSELFPLLENRRALYLAMLLHDTGKGKGDQQIEGTKTSARACERLGLPQAETELVAWLVGHHLEMSETAQKRDISDPRTVAKFADLVGSLERLRLLYILTVADIKAVGPAVWNAWKGQLLSDLYNNTAAALRGGRTDEAGVLAELEARAERRREALVDQIGSVPAIMLEMETAYWTGFDLEDLAWQAQVLTDSHDTVAHRYLTDGGAVAVIVSGADRTGLFADLAGTLARLGANVVSAQVFTSKSGRIVDIFMLQDHAKGAFAAGDAPRMERLEQAMRDALAGKAIKGEVKTRAGRREAAFLVQPSVQIRDDLSADYTVIDVGGRDRPGLLHEVADVLADMKLSIHSAHVGSYGERVFDAFYVQTARGQKLGKGARKDMLKERLLAVLGREELEAPQTPARKLKRSRAVDSF